MNIFYAAILGILEGVTEFIPVSSTGHLIVASHLLKIPQTDFLKMFEVVIQLGAALAVLPLFLKRFFSDRKVFYRLVIAFIPTAIAGVLFYSAIKTFFNSPMTVIISLAVGGVALIGIEYVVKKKSSSMLPASDFISYKKSFLLGMFQAIAIIPGVSRSGATIAGGLLMGMSRSALVEFSFLLALPTIAAASIFDIYQTQIAWSSQEITLLAVGLIAAFVTAYFSMKWFLAYISRHSFTVFGIYRIIAAAVFFYILF